MGAKGPTGSTPRRPRWLDERPPKGSANSAWILHIAHALSTQGRAAFLMADIAAKSPQPAARKLRERLVRDNTVECVIALPPRVFGHTEATAGISRLEVTWPDARTRTRFHEVTDPLHSMARKLAMESRTLYDLKDALLRDISARSDVLSEERTLEPPAPRRHVRGD
ncbi:N-6 DNA methylase [Streptomyces sp. NPDC001373]|uniref:N-6 DNA methylase n=1 Tax=Streptomyces sp. NPDC001373 TaxID=3364565 RepID=UPI0036B7D64F